MTTRAVFLDRDGTLIEEVGYAVRPEQIRIQRGVARALARLAEAGYKLVVVTNQSGIARGLMTEADLNVFHQRLDEQLELLGARVDVYYTCPHLPDPTQAARPELAIECDCRKPKPGLLLQAAQDLGLDLRASWTVGDTWRDIQAGQAAGTRTIKVPADTEHDAPRPAETPPPTAEVDDLEEAADVILEAEDLLPPPPPPEEKPVPEERVPLTASPPVPPEQPASGTRVPLAACPPVPSEQPAPEERVPLAACPPVPSEQQQRTGGQAANGTRTMDESAATCARCGGPVTAAQVLSGEAAQRDGLLVCPACLEHVPTGGERWAESGAGVLQEILAEVRRLGRSQHTGAMSLVRMLAYIVQAGAVFAALGLGIFANDRSFYIQVAIFMQLVVLALLLFERHA